MKEKLAFIGQLDTYKRGSEIAEKLLGIRTNATCIYRITSDVGEKSSTWLKEKQSLIKEDVATDQNVVNVLVDGSFVFTKESGWKEAKLGRIYLSSREKSIDNQGLIKNSEYLAHLGSHIDFKRKLDRLISRRDIEMTELVFVNDGAAWIEKWIRKNYPDAIQILDFYHAMKHIGDFLEWLYGQGEEKKNMMEYWGSILKNEGVSQLEKEIKNEICTSKEQRKAKQKIKKYLQDNRYRMNYKEYKEKNYIIGSGAIESAHKTVIQRRMKLSGQRWSTEGARHMLDLRTVSMSGHWEWVEQYFKNAA